MVAKCLESLFEVDLNYFSHLIKKIAVEMVPNSSKFAHIYIMFCLTETSAKFNQNLSNPIFFFLSLSLARLLSFYFRRIWSSYTSASILKIDKVLLLFLYCHFMPNFHAKSVHTFSTSMQNWNSQLLLHILFKYAVQYLMMPYFEIAFTCEVITILVVLQRISAWWQFQLRLE